MIQSFCVYPKKERIFQKNPNQETSGKLHGLELLFSFECWEIKEANQNGVAPTVTCSLWMNSDTVRPVGVKPNPTGCLGAISFFSPLNSILLT